jgi:hypothetical protein
VASEPLDDELTLVRARHPTWFVYRDPQVGYVAVTHRCKFFSAGLMVREVIVSAQDAEGLAQVIAEARKANNGA